MYDQKVAEPRLVAVFDGPLPVRLDQIRAVLSEKYAVDFDFMLVNFYRDGRRQRGLARRHGAPQAD